MCVCVCLWKLVCSTLSVSVCRSECDCACVCVARSLLDMSGRILSQCCTEAWGVALTEPHTHTHTHIHTLSYTHARTAYIQFVLSSEAEIQTNLLLKNRQIYFFYLNKRRWNNCSRTSRTLTRLKSLTLHWLCRVSNHQSSSVIPCACLTSSWLSLQCYKWSNRPFVFSVYVTLSLWWTLQSASVIII